MDDERAIELYAWSRELRKRYDGHSTFAQFTEIPKPDRLIDEREAFLTTAHQDLQDLANFVNEFTLNANALSAWAAILPSLDKDELLPVTMEFINPTCYFCLGAPYALKGRLHASIARVSHLANEFVLPEWQHIPNLGHSSLDQAKEHAAGWNSCTRLTGCLGRLDNKPFRSAVTSFRNEFHHGSPRMIVIGAKRFVERSGDLTVSGEVPPMSLKGVVAALQPQQKAAVAAYTAYRALVLEQVGIVMANNDIERASPARLTQGMGRRPCIRR